MPRVPAFTVTVTVKLNVTGKSAQLKLPVTVQLFKLLTLALSLRAAGPPAGPGPPVVSGPEKPGSLRLDDLRPGGPLLHWHSTVTSARRATARLARQRPGPGAARAISGSDRDPRDLAMYRYIPVP